ncbi:MAG TPA: GreA/GreB family elongation factor [Vitreimonas sp.]|uniref:GreA/GreB family elongation factor n=1 Tax=Vitreimonas sp. TaxID=3069702 RepID=UPI002D49E084|nr:GreA/GreB family elongation factor [Vitreimonas sp.]HYD89449.1 GreA/GreB family elongation factor [Vitreimonas sp.]
MSTQSKPDILINQDDHEELIELALKAIGRSPGAALLLQEMERAKVVSDVPPNVLGMNGAVDFEYDGRRYEDYHLVYPNCADFANGRISVLTPVGAALIGLAEGQTMWWPGDQRAVHRLTVLKVNGAAPH